MRLGVTPVMALLVLAFGCLGAVSMTGCSDGQDVTIFIPQNDCSLPPDPGWRGLLPVFGYDSQTAVIEASEDEYVIVGTSGLTLAWSNGYWFRENSNIERNLSALSPVPGGGVIAVGDGGTAALRQAGVWTRETTGVTVDLVAVADHGSDVWAVGEQGVVLRRRSNLWEQVPTPVQASWQGVTAASDTLYVYGDSLLMAWDGGHWHDRSSGPWVTGAPIQSAAVTSDDRLVVLADSLYCRTGSQWRVQELGNVYGEPFQPIKIKASGGRLWVWSSWGGFFLIDESTADWTCDTTNGYVDCIDFAAQDDLNLLSIQSQSIRWHDNGENHWDPQSASSSGALIRLQDQTILLRRNSTLYRLRGARLERISTLLGLADDPFSGARAIAGDALDNFHFVLGGTLKQYSNGQVTEVTSLPEGFGTYSTIYMAQDRGGCVYVADYREAACYWNGDQWTEVFSYSDTDDYSFHSDQLYTTQQNHVIFTTNNHDVFLLEAGRWLQLNQSYSFMLTQATPEGRITSLRVGSLSGSGQRPHYLHTWYEGLGYMNIEPVTQEFVCPEGMINGGVDHPTGIYVFTRGPSVVYRMSGEPGAQYWDFVAGATPRPIDQLAVQPDGTLVAVDSHGRLYVYSP